MLSLRNFSVIRGGKRIVQDVNLDFEEGAIHVILGANGSGKSTLAQGIMGIFSTGGSIVLGGEEISSLKIHERAQRGITLAFQEPARFEGITVKDYLLISSWEKKLGEVEEALKMVGLPRTMLSQDMDESLSGGERKRIELASVLLMKPRFAILDEPDSGIDIISFKRIAGAIRKMRDHGAGVILITHAEEMIALGDRASIMCNGRVVITGEPGEVRKLFTHTPCPIKEVG